MRTAATEQLAGMMPSETAGALTGDAARTPVLLFDDTCGFCNAAVQTVLRGEQDHTLLFASLHGGYGLAFRDRHPELRSIDSMVWFEPGNGRSAELIAIRSEAALRTADYIGGLFRLAGLGRLLPRWLRDALYDFVARHRHTLLPTPEECLVPTPDQRSRFLP
jgi:predicted DCC family thiol-disulfide oxidoreductase YuxK